MNEKEKLIQEFISLIQKDGVIKVDSDVVTYWNVEDEDEDTDIITFGFDDREDICFLDKEIKSIQKIDIKSFEIVIHNSFYNVDYVIHIHFYF
jgi:hypothetical protein